MLAVDVPRQLNADCWDVDGDGVPEVVLAYGFETSPDRSIGNVVLLHRGADVRQPWKAQEIDRVPTAHRAAWIDADGTGKKLLLVAPMVGRRFPPGSDDPVPIYVYRPGQWKREMLSSLPQGVLHAINPVRWNEGPRQQLLTASYLGLYRFEWTGGQWVATQLAKGDPALPEVRQQRSPSWAPGTHRFLAAIEPWHGNQLVVYVPDSSSGGAW